MNTSRYFKCTQGNHDKFWIISLQDRAYIVRFGRNGTSGQKRVKTFISDLRAAEAFHMKIEEKLGKGYFEATVHGTPMFVPPSDASNVRIEPKGPTKKPLRKPKLDSLRHPKRAISFE